MKWRVLALAAVAACMLTACIAPGTHQVAASGDGAAPPHLYHMFSYGDQCYWERLRGFSGDLSDIIANNLSVGSPQYVEVKPTDAGVHNEGCTLIPADSPWDQKFPPIGGTQFFDGEYRVNVELPPGIYTSNGAGDCYWARLSGFGGELGDIIDNNLAQGPAIVSVASSDVGFESSGCGLWTKTG